MSASGKRPAAFLDRDGTIVDDVNFATTPEQLRLRAGVAEALKELQRAGVPIVIITNQSGIARGYMTTETYRSMELRLARMLLDEGVKLTATYHCPHHPSVGGACDCRKPAVGLYVRASEDLALDPSRSLFVGDRWRDIEPAMHFGGFGRLVPSPATPDAEVSQAQVKGMLASSLLAAVRAYVDEALG